MLMGAQFDELAEATGALSGMAKRANTEAYVRDLVKYTHARLADRFDTFVDIAYANSHSSLHHVYEWGVPPGAPHARLWNHVLFGSGGNRKASWEWLPSKRPIPTPQERHANPDDPMSLVPEEELEYFSDRTYFFQWKAPVMEGSIPVTILPVNVDWLAFPTGKTEKPVMFAKGIHVKNPGGDATKASFSAIWVSWWSTEAPRVFEETVGPEAERDLKRAGIRRKKRRSSANVGISTITSYKALLKRAETWAGQEVDIARRKYRSAAP